MHNLFTIAVRESLQAICRIYHLANRSRFGEVTVASRRLRYPKDLVPTIQDDIVWLADGEVEEIEQRIRGVSIPFYLGRGAVVGCDGTAFEFRYDEFFFGASLHWWEDHPAEWRPFTEAVTRIVTDLDDRRETKIQQSAAPERRHH